MYHTKCRDFIIVEVLSAIFANDTYNFFFQLCEEVIFIFDVKDIVI